VQGKKKCCPKSEQCRHHQRCQREAYYSYYGKDRTSMLWCANTVYQVTTTRLICAARTNAVTSWPTSGPPMLSPWPSVLDDANNDAIWLGLGNLRAPNAVGSNVRRRHALLCASSPQSRHEPAQKTLPSDGCVLAATSGLLFQVNLPLSTRSFIHIFIFVKYQMK